MNTDDFLSFIEFLKDVPAYEAKAKELKDRETAINDAVASLKIAGEIANARQEVAATLESAKATLEAAKIQAADIVQKAGETYKARFSKLAEQEVAAQQAVATAAGVKAAWDARETALRQSEKDVETLRAQLHKGQAELSEKQAEVNARLEKLRNVMG